MNKTVRDWLVQKVIGAEDEEMLALLYGDYISTLDVEIPKACALAAAGNFAELDVTAHTLKGATMAVGDTEMYDTVIKLRDAAKASDGASASDAASMLVALRAAR